MMSGSNRVVGKIRSRAAVKLLILLIAVFGGIANCFAGRDGEILVPQAGEILEAGTYYLVSWSSPAEAEELELLLFWGDSPARKVRLTEELDPAVQSYLWLVPDMPVQSARIELRWGVGGVEIPGPPGADFEIRSSTHNAALELRWFAGEWWLTPGPGETELPPRSRRLDQEPLMRSRIPAFALACSEFWSVPSHETSFDALGSCGAMSASLVAYWPSSRFPQTMPMRC
jgi:hypothetical protein